MAEFVIKYELKPRVEVKADKRKEVMNYGDDNMYPTRMERLINGSVTAKQCANMYSRFLTGGGFVDASLNDIVVGKDITGYKDITAVDLLTSISNQLAYYGGVWIYRGLNGEYDTSNLRVLDFKNVRFGKMDSSDYAGKIIYYDNWDKSKEGKIKSDDFIKYYAYNTNKDVIKAQADDAGGFRHYKGQVTFLFLDNTYIYPVSPIDVVQHDADTENMIQLFKNGELRRGFFAKYILTYTKFESEQAKKEFFRNLQTFQGAENGGSILVNEGAFVDNNGRIASPFTINKVEQNINSDIFEQYEDSVSNNIRKSFNNIPPVLIDYQEGKLSGTSGESIVQATQFYNSQTARDRKAISGLFGRLMSTWKDKSLRNKNWDIIPLKLYGDVN